ncbi:hypothetical protein BC332_03218 [Capsicum chinense]|nr:hypothetical protein BC332_03218 [Capsicum chinense]
MIMIILVIQILPLLANVLHANVKTVDVTVEAIAEEHNITVDYPSTAPSTASKEEEKVEDYDLFIATYAEYLSDGLQVPNDKLDAELLRKRYTALLWKYREVKAQKSYASGIKDPRRPKPNSVAPDEEQLVHIE